jgi:hypothetical protein
MDLVWERYPLLAANQHARRWPQSTATLGRAANMVDAYGRAALEGGRDALAALAERLAEIPTPAGPTPRELGTAGTFIPLTNLLDSLSSARPGLGPGRPPSLGR